VSVLRVIAAAVLSERGLLLVSKRAAPTVFYLPGGKPEPGESELACLERELREELGVGLGSAAPFVRASGPAALEGVELDMSVFLAELRGTPTAAAEIAELARWPDRSDLRLAPAVRDSVVPELEAAGLLRPSEAVVVRRVPAERTVPLRAEVLRPGLPPCAVVKPDDDHPDTWFFAALAPDGTVLSTVNIRPDGADWWRLRGMATAADARGHGYARAVVETALDHVDRIGGRVRCNARTHVLDFYARFGFRPIGEPWTDPVSGPHRLLVRERAP
jgi:8-oxo-dGTP diphosphatase